MLKRYQNRSMQSFKYEGRRVRALEVFETEKSLPPSIAELVDDAPPEPPPALPPEPKKSKVRLTRVAFDPRARTLKPEEKKP